ncbi:hypothetical protein ABW20_dc0101638 [Dactylellina cionopaga]|nr:hypothetical protein ABW20_dc0101638 [Dactylellina cionopaga]
MSALHLSIKNPSSRNFYRSYATGLQTRALALFNESNPDLEVTPANYVHMFLFSSLIGVHLLCDTLHYHRDSLEAFTDGFAHCFGVFRGVLAVIEPYWDLLRETEEVAPGLNLLSEKAIGPECDALRELANATTLGPSSRKALLDSVFHLQRRFFKEIEMLELEHRTKCGPAAGFRYQYTEGQDGMREFKLHVQWGWI